MLKAVCIMLGVAVNALPADIELAPNGRGTSFATLGGSALATATATSPTDGWTVVADSPLKSEWVPGYCGFQDWAGDSHGYCDCHHDNPGDADGNVFLKANEHQGASMFNIPDIMIYDTTANLCSNRRFKTQFDSSTVLQVDFDYEMSQTGSNEWYSLWLNPGDTSSWNSGEVDMVEGLWGRGASTNYGGARPDVTVPTVDPADMPRHPCGDTNHCKEWTHPAHTRNHVTQYIGGAAGNTWSQTCDFGSSTCQSFENNPDGFINNHGPDGNFFDFRTSPHWNAIPGEKTWDLIADVHNTMGNNFWIQYTNIRITPMPASSRALREVEA